MKYIWMTNDCNLYYLPGEPKPEWLDRGYDSFMRIDDNSEIEIYNSIKDIWEKPKMIMNIEDLG